MLVRKNTIANTDDNSKKGDKPDGSESEYLLDSVDTENSVEENPIRETAPIGRMALISVLHANNILTRIKLSNHAINHVRT